MVAGDLRMTDTAERLPTIGLNLPASVTNPTLGLEKTGVVKDFTASQAVIVLETHISPGTSVYVAIKTFAFDGEVLSCEQCDDRFEAHIYVNDSVEASSRRSLRFPVRLSASVVATGVAAPIPATIVDISGEGLGIDLPVHFAEESIIAVESEGNLAFGIVRYARQLPEGGFRIGVRVFRILPKQATAWF